METHVERTLRDIRRRVDALYAVLVRDDTTPSQWMDLARERGALLQHAMNLSPATRSALGCDPTSVVCLF